MKKLAIMALTAVSLFTLLLAAACGKKEEGEKPNPGGDIQAVVTLDKTSATVDLFDELMLTAERENTTEAVEWNSSVPAVATVEGGFVVPAGVGQTVITASAGGASATCSVTVTAPEEDVEIDVSYQSLSLETGGSQKLAPKAYLGAREISGGAFTYSVTEGAAVTVSEDGTVTAVAAGEATVRVDGTVRGITMKEYLLPVTVTDPVTHENYEILRRLTLYGNREDALEIDLSEYTYESITEVKLAGLTVEFTATDTGVSIASDQFVQGGNTEVTVFGLTEAGDITVTGNVLFVNFAIGSAEEFSAFGDAANRGANSSACTPYMYVILTDDFDYGGQNFTDHFVGGYFYGVFDGQGHTVNNIKAVNAVFPGIYGKSSTETSLVKNVAFTNVLRDTANGGALFVNDFNHATIENVYVSGKVTAYQGGLMGGLIGSFNGGGVVKNVLVAPDFRSKNYNALAGAGAGGSVESAYAISSNSTGKMYGEIEAGLYSSVGAFKEAVTVLPSSFDPAHWEMKEGMLVFKSAAKYAVTSLDISTEHEGTEVAKGASVAFSATHPDAVFALKAQVAGVSVVGNSAVVETAAETGTTFTVVVSYTDVITGKTLTAESAVFTVIRTEIADLPGEETVALNRGADSFSFDLSAHSLTAVTSVTVGEAALSADGYSFESGTLTVQTAGLSGRDSLAVRITGTIEAGYITVSAGVRLIDYVIGSAEELTAFAKGMNSSASGEDYAARSSDVYVLLDADVDYRNGVFSDAWSNGAFTGVFDGQGHTVSNLRVQNSIFRFINGRSAESPAIIRNVAFVNVVKHVAAGGGVLAHGTWRTRIENVYVYGVVNEYTNQNETGLINYGTATVLENVLFYIDYKKPANSGGFFGVTSKVAANFNPIQSMSGVYGILPRNGAGKLTPSVEGNCFSSVADFKAAVKELPAGFDVKYWEMQDGMLVFKSAVRTEPFAVSASLDGTEIPQGETVRFTANAANVSFALIDAVDGVAITADGMLTVESIVAPDTKFSVKATSYDPVTDKMLTAVSSEYTVVTSKNMTLDGDYLVAGNREGQNALALDLSEHSLTAVLTVSVNGTPLAAGAWTWESGVLTLPFASVSARGNLAVVVSGRTETGYLTATAQALFADYAIGSAAEFSAFGDAINTGGNVKTPFTYAVVTASFDYQDENFWHHYAGGYFYGVFDGLGHTISNIKIRHGIFTGLIGASASDRTVIRNIAFVGVKKYEPNGGGFLANEVNNVLIENVYFEGKQYVSSSFGGLFASVTSSVTVKNLVARLDYLEEHYAIAPSCSGTLENVYAVSANSNGKMYGGVTEGLFVSDEAFKAAVPELPDGFDVAYWEMKDGMLSFKSKA